MDINIPLHLPNATKQQITKAQTDATDSDARFVSQLLDGYKWQLYVLNAIMAYGHWGCIHPLHVRPDFESRGRYSDAYDILIGSHPNATNAWSTNIDVKARTRAFETPADFPFPTVIIEPKARFDKRAGVYPDYWAHVSQYTGGIVLVGSTGIQSWDIETKRGREYITAPVKDCLSLEDFISSLPSPLVVSPQHDVESSEDADDG